MNKKNNLLYLKKNSWTNNNNKVWITSSLSFSRNIEKFFYPSKLDFEKKNQVISLVNSELSKIFSNKYKLIISKDLTPTDKEFLMEHFLTMNNFQQAHSGEAFVFNKTGNILISINIKNHLTFEIIDQKGDIESSWNQLTKNETDLGKSIEYSFSNKFGFLTANPKQCGTGFVLTTFLQPTALIHTKRINDILDQLKSENINITGIQGNPECFIGDIYAISNKHTIGVTEENIITTIRIFTTKLMVKENGLRSQLRRQNNPEIKDKIARAYGILTHSYQIEIPEALETLSLLKLGVDLSWIDGITISELNELFFNCQRGHLLTHAKVEIPIQELSHYRADFLHKGFKKAKLKI